MCWPKKRPARCAPNDEHPLVPESRKARVRASLRRPDTARSLESSRGIRWSPGGFFSGRHARRDVHGRSLSSSHHSHTTYDFHHTTRKSGDIIGREDRQNPDFLTPLLSSSHHSSESSHLSEKFRRFDWPKQSGVYTEFHARALGRGQPEQAQGHPLVNLR